MNRDANFIRATLAGLGLIGILAMAAVGSISTAMAGATIEVPVDQARVVQLTGKPGTIIVGNPGIADVNLRSGRMLVVQGKAFGTTNIIILSKEGEQIANMDVLVGPSDKFGLAIYSSAGRKSYRCKPFCEGEMNTGDASGFFNKVKKQNSDKNKSASGKHNTDVSDE
ncbi:MAG: pilus assembly protein N-terminal domain-containing protein [Hyphomicrobiales bacterium]